MAVKHPFALFEGSSPNPFFFLRRQVPQTILVSLHCINMIVFCFEVPASGSSSGGRGLGGVGDGCEELFLRGNSGFSIPDRHSNNYITHIDFNQVVKVYFRNSKYTIR